jgi:uncharacterized membrane protein
MVLLTLGLLMFADIHLVPSPPKVRANLINRLGEGSYLTAFTGITLVGSFHSGLQLN